VCSTLHNEGPVIWSPYYGGFWVAVSHAAVSQVERDNETFSSRNDGTGKTGGFGGVAIPPSPFVARPVELDPPEFHHYRGLLNPYFSPASAQRWKPFVDAAVDHCLDKICERGSGDFVLDLANPVPAVVTCAILGLPLDDWKVIAEPAHMLVWAPPESEAWLLAREQVEHMAVRLAREIEGRRDNPRDDLMSVLARAEVDGELISIETAVQMAHVIVFGGVDTTTGLAANALVWLDQHEEHREQLLRAPEMWQKATEEFLRYFSPVQAQARTVTRETTVQGCPMSAGDRVLMSLGAANRDPAVFSDADVMDLRRTPNQHTAFGLGIHRCLGSNLARIVFRSMMEGVLRRMPDYRVDHENASRYTSVGIVNGWVSVPATWSPTPTTSTPYPEPPPVTTSVAGNR
jgi:cytochrome P450